MKFILIAAHSALNEFRLAEIESIATLFNFNFSYPDQSHLDITRPYLVIDLPSQVEANLLGSRLIGIKSIWEHWADAQSYHHLHQIIQSEAKYVSFNGREYNELSSYFQSYRKLKSPMI